MSRKVLIILLLVLLAVLLVPVLHYNKYDAVCLPCPPTEDCPPCPRKGWEFKKPILLQLISILRRQQVSDELGEAPSLPNMKGCITEVNKAAENPPLGVAKNELLVSFDKQASENDIENIFNKYNLKIVRVFDFANKYYYLRTSDGTMYQDFCRLKDEALVTTVDFNRLEQQESR